MAIGPKQTILMIGSDEAEYERMLQFRTAYKKYTPRVHVITCKDIPDADKRDAVFSVKDKQISCTADVYSSISVCSGQRR